MSWPVPESLMIEPTESESKDELDRYVAALVSIREEIREVEEGKYPQDDNVLVNAPHSLQVWKIGERWGGGDLMAERCSVTRMGVLCLSLRHCTQ